MQLAIDGEETKLILPIAKPELRYPCLNSWHAAFNTIKALESMEPKSKFYMDQNSFFLAKQQHLNRLKMLETIQNEIYQIWVHLQPQEKQQSLLTHHRMPPRRHELKI